MRRKRSMAKRPMNPETQRVQFGKYKGKLVSWVVENDLNYALWLAKQSNSTTMTKRAAQSLTHALPHPSQHPSD